MYWFDDADRFVREIELKCCVVSIEEVILWERLHYDYYFWEKIVDD